MTDEEYSMSVYGSPSDELFTAVHNVTATSLTNEQCADIINELWIQGYEIIRTVPDTPTEPKE